MFRSNLLALVCSFAIGACTLSAQEESQAPSAVDKAPTSVALTADGQLVGNAFATIAGIDQPIEAKITLTKNGVVVKSILANEDGSFAFPSVAPGVYNMYGAAANYVGGKTVAVTPTTAAPGKPVALGLNSYAPGSYSSFGYAPAAAQLGGNGGFGGGFVGGGGGLGIGPLAKLGLLGGVVALAVADDDSSPDD